MNPKNATVAQPRRIEAGLDGKWTKVAQADKFVGRIVLFTSSWTKEAQADKLKGR